MFFFFVVWQKLFEDLLSIFKKAYIIDLSQVKLNFLLPVPEIRGDGLWESLYPQILPFYCFD